MARAVGLEQPDVELPQRRLQRTVDAAGQEARALGRLHADIDRHVLRPDLRAALAHRLAALDEIGKVDRALRQQPAAVGDAVRPGVGRHDAGRPDQRVGDGARREHHGQAGRQHGEGDAPALLGRQGGDGGKGRLRPPAVLHHAAVGRAHRHRAHDRIVARLHLGEAHAVACHDAGGKVVRADMHVLRMVGVGEILDLDLPVPRQRRVAHRRRQGFQPGRLVARPQRLELGEARRQGRRLRVEVDEDEAMPELQAERRQPHRLAQPPHRLCVTHARRTGEPALEIVGPEMERAADGLALLRARNDLAAVLADGAERADRAVLAAHHEQRFAGDLRRQAVARVGYLLDPADADPAAAEHFSLLEGEEFRRGIAAGRQHPLLHRRDVQRGHLCEQGFDHGRSGLAATRAALSCKRVHMCPPGNHSLPFADSAKGRKRRRPNRSPSGSSPARPA